MSTETSHPPRARPAPMILGVILVGIGTTAFLAVQTGLSLAQSASICMLGCAVILLSFLIDRARAAPADRSS